MRRGTLDRCPHPPHPNLRKEAVISLLVCCALSVKEFRSRRLWIMTSITPGSLLPLPRPQTVAACQRKEGGVALNNTLAFMEMYQMFQE